MASKKILNQNKTVLVCVLRTRCDKRILLNQFWYRIPKEFAPKRKFSYLAFYQPTVFGRRGKRIEYYARIKKSSVVKRIDILPADKHHPKAQEQYVKFEVAWVKQLVKPIKNIIPRRVSFGFTSLKSLQSAGDILELYGVAPTEQIVEKVLQVKGIKVLKEQTISKDGKRYRIDLVIICKNGRIAIECDNAKAHSGKVQQSKDRTKDLFLKQNGWHVVRLSEQDVLECIDKNIKGIMQKVVQLGGAYDSVTISR